MTKQIKKVIALLLILSVMMGFVGCAFFDKIHATIDPKKEYISAPEIVRLLISAIDDDKNLADSYASIPEGQRKDISFSYYFEYISILKEFTKGNGKIQGFRFLNDEENSKHLDSIYNKLAQNSLVDDYYTVFSQYGEVRTVIFEFSKESDYPVCLYIPLDEEGFAYLSYDLISHLIASYNYMQQYFKLISAEKADGISALLDVESKIPEEYVGSVINARSSYILDFYKLRVKNTPEQFELCAANPFYVEYNIPKVVSYDGGELYNRKVYAFRNPNGFVSISDPFELETDNVIATVNVSATQYLRCGLEYDYSAISRICGKPISTYLKDGAVSVTYDKDGNPIEKYMLLVSYNGMNLSFVATYNSETDWIGELVSIRLYSSSSEYNVCGIKVGDSELSILEHFPMINYGDYIITYEDGKTSYKLEYEVKDSVIKDIVIGKQ